MALAKLTVELDLALARFEGDAGKASQIIDRDSAKMAASVSKADAAVRRFTGSFGQAGVESKVIAAALAGASDGALRLFADIDRGAGAFARVGSQGGAAFKAVGVAADSALQGTEARILLIAQRAREVRDQAEQLKTKAVAENTAGTLDDAGLKKRLADIRAVQAAELQRIATVARADADAEREALTKAAQEAAAAEARQTAARKLIDAQNGISASYRQQLRELRELRDAGDITPAQFRRAGADLVADQPAVRQRQAAVVAERRAAESFLASLNERAAGINADGSQKAQSQLLAEKAAILGVGTEAQAAIAKIAALEGRTGQLGRTAGSSRSQLLTLQYTISDVIASAGSGISPLTILLQQGPQLAQVEGGIGGIFRTAIGLVTPFRAAMGVATASIGAFGFAWLEGAKQSKEAADAIVLSGNFVGQTQGQFNGLISTIADGGRVTASAAREMGQALIATGEIAPEVFGKATGLAALFGKATGQTAKDVAQSFATMSRDAGKWASEQNRSFNFVTAAQLDHIRALQESGRSVDAQLAVYDALGLRLQALEPNLSTLDRAIRSAANTWSQFWNSAYDIGRPDTLEDKLRRAQQAAAQARLQAADPPSIGPYGGPRPSGATRLAGALENQKFAERAVDMASENAAAEAALAKLNKDAARADEFVDGFGKRTKSVDALNKALADAARNFAKQDELAGKDATYKASEAYQQSLKSRSAILAQIRKDFTDRGAVSDANSERKALLDKDLQVFAAALARERDTLKFSQDELRAVYDAGNLSLAKFYDDRQAIIRRGTQAELNEQASATGRLAQELGRRDLKPDERTKLERQLADAQAKAADIQRGADSAAALATYERAAAVKALTLEVNNFRSSLADLQGDPLGAAQLRAAQQVDAARQLAARAAPAGGTVGDFARFDRGQPTVDVDGYARALAAANDFAEVQRKLGVATANASRAEEAYLLRARVGGASLKEQEQAVFTLRSAALSQLGELTQAAQRLAEASTDPRIKAFAADLALQYAQAAEAVDPAFNRLKAGGAELGTSLANVFGDAINNGTTFLNLVNNIGRTVQASITKTIITEPLEAALKVQISNFVGGDNPLASLLRDTVGASAGAGGAAQAAAAQAATLSISQLALAAGQATVALQTIAAGSGVSSPAVGGGFLGSLFSGIGELFSGGGGLLPGGIGAVPYHSGGLVGQGGAARAVSAATFAGARRYHEGGVASAVALGTHEVPAILMGGPRGTREEVLTATDPRHRDNLGGALLQALAAGGVARGMAGGYTRPVMRYHSGGIAGLAPDSVASMERPSSRGSEGRRSGITNITINMPAGTSRETADQMASRMAQKIGAASRRNN